MLVPVAKSEISQIIFLIVVHITISGQFSVSGLGIAEEGQKELDKGHLCRKWHLFAISENIPCTTSSFLFRYMPAAQIPT